MISHRFLFRTVTNIQKNTNVTKRVSFGIADDKRGDAESQLSPGWWTYVADLVLSHGETYGGDRVAFGAAPIRASWSWFTWASTLVHRVNPVAGEELVFVIDWRVVQES